MSTDESPEVGAADDGTETVPGAEPEAPAKPRSSRRRVRRGPILFVVIAAMVAAAVVQHGVTTTSDAAAVVGFHDGASVPPPDAVSASWYCAEGTSNPGGRADETVLIASLAGSAVDATVTVMLGGDVAPVTKRFHIDAGQERRVHVADLVQSAEPGVVVEVEGGRAAVSHQLVHGDDIAVEPCTRSAATDWYFAAGTSVKGSEHYLALFNPFGDDAIVDVTFLTDTGVQQPDETQAVVVPRRTRVTLAVHDAVPRQERIATSVKARAGRVVVERTQIFDGTQPDVGPTRDGIAVSLGATSPAAVWHIAAGTTRDGGTASLGLANFADTDASVSVDVTLAGNQSLPPQTVSVPASGVVAVDITARVPADTDYAVTVTAQSVDGVTVPVVAESLASWPPGAAVTGVASTMGSAQPARRWITPAPDSAADGYLTVMNLGTVPVSVRLTRAAGDGPTVEHTIAKGSIGVFHVAAVAAETGALIVTADHPVVVGLTVLGSVGASTSAAIPDFSYDG